MNVRVMTLALAAMLAIPAALAAGWAGKGQYEPDTSFDTPSYMWANPDVSAQPTTGGGLNAVYFNTYTQQNTGYSTHGFDLSANLATVKLERQSWPGNLAALLGVWKDCNKDSYIGLGDQGLLEYRSELLLDTSVCPPITSGQAPPSSPASASWNWTGALVHNDGIWVREFIAIGPESRSGANPLTSDANPYDISDNAARA